MVFRLYKWFMQKGSCLSADLRRFTSKVILISRKLETFIRENRYSMICKFREIGKNMSLTGNKLNFRSLQGLKFCCVVFSQENLKIGKFVGVWSVLVCEPLEV